VSGPFAKLMNRAVRPARDTRFETIIMPHLDSAYNLARWLVRDAGLAEDVVQDAVVRALAAIDTHHGTDSRPWLMRIVRNAAYDTLAARKRHDAKPICTDDEQDSEFERLEDPADLPDVALGRAQDHAMLHDALDKLAVNLRECLVLRELEDLSYAEIAAVTGVPIGTVMSRLWRGRRALADLVTHGAAR
jgi:RNA polymerase sigma factor (sigma-70 family)